MATIRDKVGHLEILPNRERLKNAGRRLALEQVKRDMGLDD
jgi:hypothetical protein